ncbi:hypothetical protein ABL78_8514 [Leptomonas seymouri]|uniref:Uncharacterized protein n=1 Tax=Leptomonas seymouri TaxID=5684 RepID=A0A0N0P230_LEPSE|nr:hypothetical protein ABL78_8514 [Leptomonas seymouri]|eukprot:KPI82476.1 hypothetical protein ABL78_8514 [Leptomonas seymouri]
MARSKWPRDKTPHIHQYIYGEHCRRQRSSTFTRPLHMPNIYFVPSHTQVSQRVCQGQITRNRTKSKPRRLLPSFDSTRTTMVLALAYSSVGVHDGATPLLPLPDTPNIIRPSFTRDALESQHH